MTTEELIIGHFEGELTPASEQELARVLESSPEARALYDAHGEMSGMMVAESQTLKPTRELDETVIASALGVLAGGIGGGALWLTGKVAAVLLGSAAVGGIGILMYNVFTQDEPTPSATHQPAPATRTVTPSVASEPPAATTDPAPATTATNDKSTATTPTTTKTTTSTRSSTTVRNNTSTARTTPKRTAIDLHRDNPDAVVNQPTKVGRGK
jgi:hypothetical protein